MSNWNIKNEEAYFDWEIEKTNVHISIQQLIHDIYAQYDEAKSSKIVGEILQKIAHGGNYRNIYEFCRTVGLGDIFKNVIDVHQYVLNMEDYNDLANEFMKVVIKYANDINDIAEIVQKSINDTLGIRIKPQRAQFQKEKLDSVVKTIMDGIPTSEDDTIKLDGLNSLMSQFGVELTDDIINNNAEIQAKSGFDIVLIRKYDDVGIHNYANYSDKRKATHGAEVCKFCADLEGIYNYADIDSSSKVWRRHKGCSCSIDYVNNGITKRVKNYVKRR